MADLKGFGEHAYGKCEECHCPLEAVKFEEEEIKTNKYGMYKTGRKRIAVDYLFCPICLKRYCVDDTFDGEWRK